MSLIRMLEEVKGARDRGIEALGPMLRDRRGLAVTPALSPTPGEPPGESGESAEVAIAPTGVPSLPALYVATDLESWAPEHPEIFARDLVIEGKAFRRLDAEYLAWLGSRLDRARNECDSGRFGVPAMIELEHRWLRLRNRAARVLGEDSVRRVESGGATDSIPRDYAPPEVPGEENIIPALSARDRLPHDLERRAIGGASSAEIPNGRPSRSPVAGRKKSRTSEASLPFA